MYDELAREFGTVLRKHRHAKNLTQLQLAELCDLDMTYIGLLERSKRTPSLRTVFVLANALGVSPTDMVNDVEQRLNK